MEGGQLVIFAGQRPIRTELATYSFAAVRGSLVQHYVDIGALLTRRNYQRAILIPILKRRMMPLPWWWLIMVAGTDSAPQELAKGAKCPLREGNNAAK